MLLYAALFAATFVGMVLHASIGFGFAFLVAPISVALFEPEEAITLLLVLGLAINALVLAGERRRIDVHRRPLAIFLLAAVPGLLLGAVIVQQVSTPALQIVVGSMILGAAALQLRREAIELRVGPQRPHLLAAGAVAGVLTTATSLNGPAVVVGLLSLGWRGGRLRDGTAATLLALSILGLAAVVLLSGASRSFPSAWVLVASAPLVVLGHRIGAATFRRLDERRHKRLVVVASALAGIASVAAGVW